MPLVFDMIFKNLTKNDRIITGDSGPGYINPTQLFEPREISNLPAADKVWLSYSQPYYQKFDISFTGFVINGASGRLTNAAEDLYRNLSPDGMVEQTGYQPGGLSPIHLQGSMPVFQEIDFPNSDSPKDVANVIVQNFKQGLVFQVYRAILKSPTFLMEVGRNITQSGKNFAIVEPLVFSALGRISRSK